MPIVSKLRDIYLAKTLTELRLLAENSKTVIKLNDISSSTKSSLKLYSEANKSVIEGDEERAFVLFYRFVDIYTTILKSNEYKKAKNYVDNMVSSSKFKDAIEQMERLTISIEKRYKASSDSETMPTKSMAFTLHKSGNDCESENKKSESSEVYSDYPVIDCVRLLETIENSSEITKLLILDTRTADEYKESHIDRLKTVGDLTLANIPNNFLTPGLTVSKLEKILPLGIELRINSSPVRPLLFSPKLFGCTTCKIKSMPLLLKGGYREWLMMYPMYSSNSCVVNKYNEHVSPPKISLPFQYEFNDDMEENNKIEKPKLTENVDLENFMLRKQIEAIEQMLLMTHLRDNLKSLDITKK